MCNHTDFLEVQVRGGRVAWECNHKYFLEVQVHGGRVAWECNHTDFLEVQARGKLWVWGALCMSSAAIGKGSHACALL